MHFFSISWVISLFFFYEILVELGPFFFTLLRFSPWGMFRYFDFRPREVEELVARRFCFPLQRSLFCVWLLAPLYYYFIPDLFTNFILFPLVGYCGGLDPHE